MYHQNLFFVIKPTNIDLPNTIPYDKIPYDSDSMIFCDYFEGYFYYSIDSYNYNNFNDNNSLIYKQYTDFMHTDDYLGYVLFARMPKNVIVMMELIIMKHHYLQILLFMYIII